MMRDAASRASGTHEGTGESPLKLRHRSVAVLLARHNASSRRNTSINTTDTHTNMLLGYSMNSFRNTMDKHIVTLDRFIYSLIKNQKSLTSWI